MYIEMNNKLIFWPAFTEMTLFLVGNIIILIDFYGADILRNLSSEAQQNRISVIVNRDAQKSVSERGTTEHLWWECNLE